MSNLMNRRNRGAVLIVVLGVLVLLALIATVFATVMRVERNVARNSLDGVRAKLIARSGMEHAIQNLQTTALRDSQFPSGVSAWRYYGDDVTEDTATEQDEVARRSTPLRWALNPSYAMEDETPFDPTNYNVEPQKIMVRTPSGEVRPVGFSGMMESGTYGPKCDQYSLRVLDCSGMIYVNDGLYLYGGNQSSVSQNLRRVLNNLGAHPQVDIKGLGDRILKHRTSAYRNKLELLAAMDGDRELYNRLKSYVTTHGWVDKNVVNPVPLSALMAQQYPVQYYRHSNKEKNGIYRRGRGPNHKGADNYEKEPLAWLKPGTVHNTQGALYAHDELAPSYIEVTWRAPVNVNAATEPVLAALLADLSGFYHVERRRNAPAETSPPDISYKAVNWFPPNMQITIPKNHYTWEYMGATYDTQQWKAPSNIVEYKHWADLQGAHQANVTWVNKPDADEIGFLYRTPPIGMFSGTGTQSGSSAMTASVIAREIIKCRSRQAPYSSLPFGGPFRNWAQFNKFCDYLAATGILRDTVNNFWDHHPITGKPIPSPAQKKLAGQAIADVLKANFNPNLHLNENNPDRNLYTMVDKTDLISNTTEFCFLPTGFFEVESLGRVLRPEYEEGNRTRSVNDAHPHEIVSEAKFSSTVQLFTVYRESTQRHFYLGSGETAKRRSGSLPSNMMHTIEIGPEPDNGPLLYADHLGDAAPDLLTSVRDGYAGYGPGKLEQPSGWGYEFEGYMALPTLGSHGLAKPKGTIWATPTALNGEPNMGDAFHAHFEYDFDCHKHQSATFQSSTDFRREMAHREQNGNATVTTYENQYDPTTCGYVSVPVETSFPMVEKASNHPDRGEGTERGPYTPVYGSRYRLARSFRLPLYDGLNQGTGTAPVDLIPYAPSDLRMDGMYSERHSAPAYWLDENQSFDTKQGTISVWIKPSFRPEQSGKIRKVFGLSRRHRKNYYHRNPSPFDLFFFPAHNSASGGSPGMGSPEYVGSGGPLSPAEANGGAGIKTWRPRSLAAVMAYDQFDGYYWDNEWSTELPNGAFTPHGVEQYCNTPPLNFEGGSTGTSKTSYLSHHKWTHVALSWRLNPNSSQHTLEIRVNGQLLQDTVSPSAPGLMNLVPPDPAAEFSRTSFLDSATGRIIINTLRLGDCSTHGFEPFYRNYSADMTFDEMYLWTSYNTGKARSVDLWKQGRYYKPQYASKTDSLFTSAPIWVQGIQSARNLAPPSKVAPPNSVKELKKKRTTRSTITRTPAPRNQQVRLLGVAWTWYAEDYAAGNGNVGMVPVMLDYKNPVNPRVLKQSAPACRLYVQGMGNLYPLNQPEGFMNDGFSPIAGPNGQAPLIDPRVPVQYKVQFKIQGLSNNSVLLASPILDDVTLYYDIGGPKMVALYMEQE